ncbi:hypothetical protein AALP_AA4G142700 [Arabis alpina]|uniref:Bifunctional inhibitor/plant lipid transfer protein/seed storage helical domain-containing protein n=1 Tax=Arabis alpina TaxID=50452 RepID=A0A087H381_ARAAL|nr:hypothetical protein AALP_AA4G142700 [Arabis alpina]
MKNVSLFLVAFVILLASFPHSTKANISGEKTCVTMALQVCFDGIARGRMMSTTCCETLKREESCLCDVIKIRPILDRKVIGTHIKSCGIPDPKC